MLQGVGAREGAWSAGSGWLWLVWFVGVWEALMSGGPLNSSHTSTGLAFPGCQRLL